MSMAGYVAVAKVRQRELPTRLGLAAFIGLSAWLMAPSAWPAFWFLAVLAAQTLDSLIFQPLRRDTPAPLTRGRSALYMASAAINTAVYSAISAYLWLRGGEYGAMFAMVQVAGGLLHVSLHMHHVRGLLIASVAPHACYFLGLPIITLMVTRDPAVFVVVIAALLYVAHLVVAVRQSIHTTTALSDARAEAVRQKDRAEMASAAKSDFLAVISHEIRTPMNAVISAANLLRRTRLDAQQREHVSMLLDGGDVLLGLLNDVLDFSKIEAGKMSLEAADMPVRNKLAALRRLWEPKAAGQGVRLHVQVADDVPDVVRIDPLRFQQILFNLLSNAVKFTREGSIWLRVDWDAGQNLLIAEVEDTGCGIAPEHLDNVFASFEQASAGTTRRYGGTGLGLAISRRLAQAMGGDLTVSSVQGQGSTFRVAVKAEVLGPRVAPLAEVAAAAPVSLAGRAILAADDHAVNRRILALLLEPHGCRLTLVENGAEAVEAAMGEPFDAILMDMQMPVMDGLEATRRIRGSGGPNADAPIITLTANAMDVHRAAWMQEGVQAFLTKPIDAALLARTLGEVCGARVGHANPAAEVA